MRHGRLGAGVLVVLFTLAGWIVGDPSTEPAPTPAGAARVLDLAEPARPPTTPPPTTTAPPAAVPTSTVVPGPDDATAFLAELDDLRTSRGLVPLVRRPELDTRAQAWAERMANDGDLRHSELIYEVVAGPFTAAGENVGYGPAVEVIFDALEASPGHLDNMVNPEFTSVGIGVVWVGDVLWTAHLFAG